MSLSIAACPLQEMVVEDLWGSLAHVAMLGESLAPQSRNARSTITRGATFGNRTRCCLTLPDPTTHMLGKQGIVPSAAAGKILSTLVGFQDDMVSVCASAPFKRTLSQCLL